MKAMIESLLKGETLSEEKAEELMEQMMEGNVSNEHIASLLTIMRYREETVDEITGFARAMKKKSLSIDHDMTDLLDTCGTGGDGSNTFNISTAAALVVSSLGVPVAKHGNRSVSSKTGSADVLEQLGVPIQASKPEAEAMLESVGLTFLYAPIYHSAMKHVAPARKELGVKTIFNVLGPLTNPANANRQIVGVYGFKEARKMAEAAKRLGTKRALFLTGYDGLDECSIAKPTSIVELANGEISMYDIAPEDVGLERGSIEDCTVFTSEESASLIEGIFSHEARQAAIDIVKLNAACALYVYDRCETIAEGVHLAAKALKERRVHEHLQMIRKFKEAVS
ncbi:anthranilate phosphoribosyltransferase [Texcoconibacillus texcoconensis]|uniref:Anthranilate phosphoribosyltransferase n=1 Tax=Texcoconibacillus texcoconensis TaxID=1095777 RepID=A0A840QND0_9BACI|nr:anthranilate phosphoribosyltransferase [Texcoconibacillus texcoconensis]